MHANRPAATISSAVRAFTNHRVGNLKLYLASRSLLMHSVNKEPIGTRTA